MRLLFLEDREDILVTLREGFAPFGYQLAIAPTVESAQVALQAENYDFAILSHAILQEAPYSFTDFLRMTYPEVRVVLSLTSESDTGLPKTVDWIVSHPVAPMELVQVLEYLNEDADVSRRPKRGDFTYVGADSLPTGRRNWMN